MIKNIYYILLLLCAWVIPAQLSAQIYSTAEASLRANRRSSGMAAISASAPTTTPFRSTSSYSVGSHSSAPTTSAFSTTSIRFANGSIQTSASTLTGGTLADDTDFISTGSNQTNTTWNDDEDGRGPGTPDLPLHLDWDALLFILLLLIPYLYRVEPRRISDQQA